MKVRMKIWIEREGIDLFGGGRFHLLSEVRRTGSLSQAAKNMRMSYRAAWGKVKDTEKRIGFPLLEGKIGGARGGGSTLTEKAERLMDSYEKFERDMKLLADKHLEKYLGFLEDDA